MYNATDKWSERVFVQRWCGGTCSAGPVVSMHFDMFSWLLRAIGIGHLAFAKLRQSHRPASSELDRGENANNSNAR